MIELCHAIIYNQNVKEILSLSRGDFNLCTTDVGMIQTNMLKGL